MTTEAESDDHSGEQPTPAGDLRFGYLLAALILLLLFYPFDDGTLVANLLFATVNLAILVAAVFSARRSRRTLLIALCLAVPTLALQWLHLVSGSHVTGDLLHVALVIFYSFTIFQILAEVLRPGIVTHDNICGAIAAYMLVAVAWSSLYGVVDSLLPGSFFIRGQSDKLIAMSTQDFLYFSFTTLTSTGYGDIFPVGRHAQSLAIMEQLAGVFYVAILIARLAGLYQPRPLWHRRPDRR